MSSYLYSSRKKVGKQKLYKWHILCLAFFLIIIVILIIGLNDGREKNDEDADLSEGGLSSELAEGKQLIETRSRQAISCTSGVGCHQSIEPISDIQQMAGLSCTFCHNGDENGADKNSSHAGLYPNPGDLNIVDKTCGACHPDEVSNIKKSFHATSAGVISGARYTWGAQERDSIYANYAVEDTDGNVPANKGAHSSLEQIPNFEDSNQPVDDYLRNQCLRCHIWTEGKDRDGDYRGSGCTACHVLYSDEAKYTGSDSTINKSAPGHPIKHEITTKIPAEQCVHCHNRGGRTGVSFIGTMESDGYGTPYTETGEKQPKLHGKYYNYLSPDVHYERGLQCIDCHTKNDIMGDGNIYGKKEEAVEIECADCHGTPTEYPNWDSDGKLITSGAKKANGNTYGTVGGNKFTNVEKRGDLIILTSKYDAEEHTVPVLKKIEDNGTWNSDWGMTAMSSIPHISTLECYACHATWAPQCYGCHAKQDASKPNHDWLDDDNSADSWEESRSYLRWENPILGINTEGKVAPYIPGCQVIYTFINEDGEVIELNKIYTTKDGTSGIAHNPIQPHTISAEPRTCEECHTVQKTLGLGTGIYDSSENGLEIDFELERIVDESGNQIQATSHDGARPFNKAEQKKISRVGTCLGCHQSYSDPIWDNITDEVGFAENPEAHKSVLNLVLTSFGDQEPIFVFLATDGHDSKVYLKWNISTPDEVDHYEIYWSTTRFTNVSSLQANATTQNNHYIVEGLIPDSNYYFAIVALDSGGERTGVAFSKAKPTEEQEEDHDEDEDSHEDLEENVNILIMLIIILIIIILIIIAVCIRSKKSSQSEKEKVEKERPEEEDTDSE